MEKLPDCFLGVFRVGGVRGGNSMSLTLDNSSMSLTLDNSSVGDPTTISQ